MTENKTFTIKVYRYDPGEGENPRYDTYSVAGSSASRVLDILRTVYHESAGDLAFQYACRIGRCGTCSVRVNGRPVLACQERATDHMTVEPLSPFPVIRDLVVMREVAEKTLARLQLTPARDHPHPGSREVIDPKTAREVGVMGACISCMACVSACPAVEERRFYGPAFLLQLRRLAQHPADHHNRVEQAVEAGLFECFGCDACTQVCPADLSPAEAIRAFRRDAVIGRRHENKGALA